MSHDLRIIDENLNRLSEGLRILEDIARMLLNDAGLTGQLKTMRHELIPADSSFNKELIESRDSINDIGASMTVSGEDARKNLPDILVANAKRTQESLRVLEEMAKLPALNLDSEKYKQARFNLYTIERNLLSRLLREDKVKRLTGIYVVLDTEALQDRDPVKIARQVIKGGAKTIQLRDKISSKRELLRLAQQLKPLCVDNNVLFIVNDHLDIALAADADGLHLGQDDLPIREARKVLPIDTIIGCSATSLDQAITAAIDSADYIGVGSIFPTTSKKDIDVCGLKVLKQVVDRIKIPVVAIGGINKSNLHKVMSAGVDAAAIISAVLQAKDPEAATRELAGMINDK
jgi:thiamine-phosphate pyrophosphorylase